MRTFILFFAWLSVSISALSQNLVAYYPFNGNANDTSSFANNGTLVNGPTFSYNRFNEANSAIQFNESFSQYVDIPNNNSLQVSNELSISVWIKRNRLNGIDQVLNKGGDVYSGTCNYGLVFTPGEFIFIYNGGYQLISGLADLNWHHYAITTANGSSEVKFYVDGLRRPTEIVTGSANVNFYAASTSNLHIGGMNYYSNNTMDELQIFKRILSAEEIQQLANATLHPDVIAYYLFNANANDTSGNYNNGTLEGSPELVADRYEKSAGAYSFNGLNQYINVPNAVTLRTMDTISIAAWVKRTRYGVDMIVEKGGDWTDGTCNYGLSLHYINNNMFYFFYNGGWRGTAGLSDFNWHHYVAVAVNGEVNPALYIDGVLKPVTYSEGGNINLFSSAAAMHIGAQVGVHTYYGANMIDELLLLKKALTLSEVQVLAALGPLPVTLINFDVRKLNATTAQLRWQTSAEINNKGFAVERSFNGTNFEEITFINAVGNTGSAKTYLFTDVPGKTGNVFYRLRQLDFDGKPTLSNIKTVLFGNEAIVKSYPNPAHQQLIIEGISEFSQMQILETTGKVLRNIHIKGQYQMEVDLTGFSDGIYFIRLTNNKSIQTIKAVIKN